MKSPFPGMDPYLEGHLWPDFHNTLATYIKGQLVPQVSPRYLVQTVVYTVMDTEAEEDIGIMYPDVSVLLENKKSKEPTAKYEGRDNAAITPPTTIIREIPPVEVQIPAIEIRDQKDRRLITAIEILSPVNKRSPGLEPYREKRKRLHQAGVHLLEIDLLRRGRRVIRHAKLPQSHYLISLWRGDGMETEIWAVDVRDRLPVAPIPLMAGEEDARLDLDKAFEEVYEMSQYRAAINYSEAPPPPAFSGADEEWIEKLLAKTE